MNKPHVEVVYLYFFPVTLKMEMGEALLTVVYGHVTFVFCTVSSAVFMYCCPHGDGEVLCKSVVLSRRKSETQTLLVHCAVCNQPVLDISSLFIF